MIVRERPKGVKWLIVAKRVRQLNIALRAAKDFVNQIEWNLRTLRLDRYDFYLIGEMGPRIDALRRRVVSWQDQICSPLSVLEQGSLLCTECYNGVVP